MIIVENIMQGLVIIGGNLIQGLVIIGGNIIQGLVVIGGNIIYDLVVIVVVTLSRAWRSLLKTLCRLGGHCLEEIGKMWGGR